MYKIKIKIIILLALLTVSLLPSQALAAGDSIYLSPAVKSVSKGSTVYISVRTNTTEAINTVQASISFPTDKLTYLSTTYSGSAFEIQAQISASGGTIQLARGTITPVSGDKLVATIAFKALSDSGAASLGVGSDSYVANAGTALPTTTSGSSLKFAAPVAPAPAPPAPVVDSVPPTITNVKVSTIGQNTATINWTTNKPADAIVSYGPDAKYGLTVATSELKTEHSIVISSIFITPKTIFHYSVSSANANGNLQTDTKDHSFTTKGIKTLVTITDKNHKPLRAIAVLVDGKLAKTTADGRLATELGLGDHAIAMPSKNGPPTVLKQFTLTATDINQARNLSLQTVAEPTSLTPLYVTGMIVTFLLGLCIGAVRWHQNTSPLAALQKGKIGWRHKQMKVSDLEKHYGDRNVDANPYYAANTLLKRLLPSKRHRVVTGPPIL